MNTSKAIIFVVGYSKFSDGYYLVFSSSNGNLIAVAKVDFIGTLVASYYIMTSPGRAYVSMDAELDSSGNVHVITSACDSPQCYTSSLRYAKMDRQGNFLIPERSILSITNPDLLYSSPALALDLNGNAHVIYYDSSLGQEGYIKLDSSGNPVFNVFVLPSTVYALASIIFFDNKIHIASISNSNVYYGQFDPANGRSILAPRQIATTTSQLAKTEMTAYNGAIDVFYRDQSRQSLMFTQLNVADGSVRLSEQRATSSDTFWHDGWNVRQHLGVPYMTTSRNLGPSFINLDVAEIVYTPEVTGPEIVPPGSTTQHTLRAPRNLRQSYIAALSFSGNPGIPLPGGFQFPLNFDSLFAISILGTPFFQNNIGMLDANGEATVTLQIPSDVPSGVYFYMAFVTIDRGLVTGVSSIRILHT